ncbi:hypothetical protein GR212_33800 [Rhizobium lusitanum]|uniref:Uncharacterized protein n=1 Tax=Rhizobium lusitanum TaxID=293958 RepID=A0A6L9UEW3_9HYPH|nr:hypothetical protein [Rhizobium lusitanum]NEI74523.1 hypothetical protein [Rhizobium lusitanum]
MSSVTIAEPRNAVSRTRLGWLHGCLAALIWGGYLAVSRQGIVAGLQAADLAFLRYATATLQIVGRIILTTGLVIAVRAGTGSYR